MLASGSGGFHTSLTTFRHLVCNVATHIYRSLRSQSPASRHVIRACVCPSQGRCHHPWRTRRASGHAQTRTRRCVRRQLLVTCCSRAVAATAAAAKACLFCYLPERRTTTALDNRHARLCRCMSLSERRRASRTRCVAALRRLQATGASSKVRSLLVSHLLLHA